MNMHTMKGFKMKTVAVSLAAALVFMSAGRGRSYAMLAPAKAVPTMQNHGSDAQTVRAFLEKKIVIQRLADYGLSPQEVTTKLSKLSDAQLHQVAMNIDQQQAAGSSVGVVLVIVGIVFLLVLLIDAVNHNDHHHDTHTETNTTTTTAPAPAAQPPQTIIVK